MKDQKRLLSKIINDIVRHYYTMSEYGNMEDDKKASHHYNRKLRKAANIKLAIDDFVNNK